MQRSELAEEKHGDRIYNEDGANVRGKSLCCLTSEYNDNPESIQQQQQQQQIDIQQVSLNKTRHQFSIDTLLNTIRNSPSPETKRLALEYYVKHNIFDEEENTKAIVECSCCYESNLNRQNLLNELDSCYRKLYSTEENLRERVNLASLQNSRYRYSSLSSIKGEQSNIVYSGTSSLSFGAIVVEKNSLFIDNWNNFKGIHSRNTFPTFKPSISDKANRAQLYNLLPSISGSVQEDNFFNENYNANSSLDQLYAKIETKETSEFEETEARFEIEEEESVEIFESENALESLSDSISSCAKQSLCCCRQHQIERLANGFRLARAQLGLFKNSSLDLLQEQQNCSLTNDTLSLSCSLEEDLELIEANLSLKSDNAVKESKTDLCPSCCCSAFEKSSLSKNNFGRKRSKSLDLSSDNNNTKQKTKTKKLHRYYLNAYSFLLTSSPVENNTGMRSLKDIGKMSLPSLSSLQYLPNQIDSQKKMKTLGIGESIGRINSVEVIEEAKSKNDHSLLHRLCLCNCISRSHDQASTQVDTKSFENVQSLTRKAPKLEPKSAHKFVHKNETESLLRGQKEKQSPSFLNLLKQSKSKPPPPQAICASQAHYDADAAHNDSSAEPVASSHRARSSSFATSQQRTSSQTPDVLFHDRPQSACSSGEERGTSFKSSGMQYKKYLSPVRLFAPTKQDDPKEKQATKNKASSSFFSRSLNRLSNRSNKGASNNNNNKDANTQTILPPENCLTPSISLSTASMQNGPTSSLESLDELDLPQRDRSRLFVGPEIVLNRADFPTTKTHNYLDKTNSNKFRPHYNSSRYTYDQCSTGGIIHESSDCTTGYISENWSERASSLPASPRPWRRIGNKRSPRLSQSPVPFNSPASHSTKIEDGLKVCSTEHFEKHIGNIKDNQVETQKKLFKAWINHFCPNLIEHDLVEELKDGIKLVGLLAHFTKDEQLFRQYERLNNERQSYTNKITLTSSAKLRHLSNVSIAIDYLRNNLNMKLINLNAMDIVSGRANVVLGLCWNMILSFQLEQNFLDYVENRQPSPCSSHCSISSSTRPSSRSNYSGYTTSQSPAISDDKENEPVIENQTKIIEPRIVTERKQLETPPPALEPIPEKSRAVKKKRVDANKQTQSNKSRNNKSNKIKKSAHVTKRNHLVQAKKDIEDPDDHDTSFISLLWRKITRAYKASISLNIVLLICLAGICVMPLMNREACCELTQDNIPPADCSLMHEKPI